MCSNFSTHKRIHGRHWAESWTTQYYFIWTFVMRMLNEFISIFFFSLYILFYFFDPFQFGNYVFRSKMQWLNTVFAHLTWYNFMAMEYAISLDVAGIDDSHSKQMDVISFWANFSSDKIETSHRKHSIFYVYIFRRIFKVSLKWPSLFSVY